MSLLQARLGKLEAAATEQFEAVDRDKRFAVVRGPIALADAIPKLMGISEDCVLVVTENGWAGGDPVLLSAPLAISDLAIEPLRIIASFRCAPDGTVQPPVGTVVVSGRAGW